MNHKNNLLSIAVAAIVVTSLLYWIDSDPPYDDVWKSVIEFIINSGIIFLFFSLVYWATISLARRG